jgi:hypothetical protein
MNEIASWVRRMRDHRNPGPATCVATRVAGQMRDFITLPIVDDIDSFAQRLAQLCRDHAGEVTKRSYMFTARDESGAKVGVMSQTFRWAQPTNARLTMLVQKSVDQAANVARDFKGLGIEAVLNVCKAQDRTIARIQAENQRLRKELDDVRLKARSAAMVRAELSSAKRSPSGSASVRWL